MLYDKFKYIDFADGGVNRRNNVVNVRELDKCAGKTEVYRTVFRFNESFKRWYEDNKSVRGYTGKHYADWLPIDIDIDKERGEKTLEDSYQKARQVIRILVTEYDYEPQHIFFSGSKGFHILIPIQVFGFVQPSENLFMIFKNIMNDIAGDLIDTSIYEINRLFRMANTKHAKSGLFKIPLSIDEFMSGTDKIKELAKSVHSVLMPPFSDSVRNVQFEELFKKYQHQDKPEKQNKESVDIFTKFSGVSEGDRDNAGMQIAGLLRSKGMEPEKIYQVLYGWNMGNDPQLPACDLQRIVSSACSYNENKQEGHSIVDDIIPIHSVYHEYRDFVRSAKKVNLGIGEFDRKIRGIGPGQVLTILGFTGNFKSATLQGMLQYHHRLSKEPVMMFELEMSRLDLFERAIQMETGTVPYFEHSGEDVEDAFRNTDDPHKMTKLADLLEENQKDFYIVDRPGLSWEDMREYVLTAEEQVYKRKTGIVGVDFLQMMSGDGNTDVQRMNTVAKGMKSFAKDLNVPLICLGQVTGVESADEALDIMHARDSKTISHMSDYIIVIYLDKDDPDKMTQIMELKKNRKGGLGKVKRYIDRKTLNFKIIDEIHV